MSGYSRSCSRADSSILLVAQCAAALSMMLPVRQAAGRRGLQPRRTTNMPFGFLLRVGFYTSASLRKRTISKSSRQVRLVPKGDIRIAADLFDHLVGAAGKGQRNGNAERLGGLEVDDQLDFRGLHDREVSRLLAFENAPGVQTGQTVRLRNAASVAHKTARGGELAQKINCWYAVAEGECAELRGMATEPRIGAGDHQRGCSQLRRRRESRFEVGFGARVDYVKPHAECIGYGL